MYCNSPYKLLIEFLQDEDPDFLDDLVIFEAGFEDLGFILQLYKAYPFYKYIGIQKENETILRITFDHDNHFQDTIPFSENETVYSKYLQYAMELKMVNPFSLEQFQNLIDLRFNTKIEDYILYHSTIIPKFKIGIFNRLFHQLESKEIGWQIVKWFQSNSTSDSLLLFSVNIGNRELYEKVDPGLIPESYMYTKEDIEILIHSVDGKILKSEFQDTFFISLLLLLNES